MSKCGEAWEEVQDNETQDDGWLAWAEEQEDEDDKTE